MRSSLLFSSCACAFVALAACTSDNGNGNGNGNGPNGTTGVTGGELDTFLAQFCDIQGPCCAPQQKTYDQGYCKEQVVQSYPVIGTSYDAAKGTACLNAARTEAAASDFCKSGFTGKTRRLCAEVIGGAPVGTKGPGETCDSTTDCAKPAEGTVHCTGHTTDTDVTKTCEVEVAGKLGDACDYTLVDGVPAVDAGKTQGSHVVACRLDEDKLYCDTLTKKCLAVSPVGGPCDGMAEHGCEADAYCDPGSNTCALRKATGATCGTENTQECVLGDYCDETKTCAAKKDDGDACTFGDQEPCKYGTCSGSTCAPKEVTLGVCQGE